ncbi:ABC transporter permease subunit [Kineococcus aurantiacus]|uniref:ABC-type spermidine/putrescine transport system permease subunit II n=1 Tax=Kineococcus aurantiacus TaxID=37633 RepID=A0A7Y9DQA6_9ACTN|nr:ABC-type spermidine/putrescine transport system permease subunit II [Kineococcus aurantiacus]
MIDDRPPVLVRSRPARRRTRSDVLLTAWGVLVLLFLFLPIAVIVVYSFNSGRLLTSWGGAGFEAYTAGLSRPVIRAAVATSLQTAVGAALLSAVIGSLAGLALARVGGRWAAGLTLLLGLTLVTPEIVDAISLLGWFVSLDTEAGLPLFGNGIARLVVAHSVLSTAVVTFIVRARVAGLDARLEEAAADLYATPWRRFRDVTLPLAAPGVLAGGLMAFTLSLDNTIVASFVSLPGASPWPVYVFSALRAGLRPEIAAVSTLLLLLTLVALAVVALVLRRSGDSASDIARTMAGG